MRARRESRRLLASFLLLHGSSIFLPSIPAQGTPICPSGRLSVTDHTSGATYQAEVCYPDSHQVMDNAAAKKPTLVVFLTGSIYTFEDYWWLCRGLSSKGFAIALHVASETSGAYTNSYSVEQLALVAGLGAPGVGPLDGCIADEVVLAGHSAGGGYTMQSTAMALSSQDVDLKIAGVMLLSPVPTPEVSKAFASISVDQLPETTILVGAVDSAGYNSRIAYESVKGSESCVKLVNITDADHGIWATGNSPVDIGGPVYAPVERNAFHQAAIPLLASALSEFARTTTQLRKTVYLENGHIATTESSPNCAYVEMHRTWTVSNRSFDRSRRFLLAGR